MYRLYCRVYQFIYRVVVNFLPWRRPERLADYAALVQLLQSQNIRAVLVVTDPGLVAIGLQRDLLQTLTAANIQPALFDQTVANPTIANIEAALALYQEQHCQAIVALGGGSPMDCAKGVGARVARPHKTIPQMRGQLKVRHRMPLFIAIPTTAGTGSETTVACIVVDSATQEKYAINDPALIPHYALLDPQLTVGLPPFLTACTGMDALCHAVEAYLGGSNTHQTRADALAAVGHIFPNLYLAYQDGRNLEARRKMQEAAFLAGAAFTRAYVGNVHAVAHTLGGQYNTSHGLANAVILPYVLEMYVSEHGERVNQRLSELAQAAGLPAADPATAATNFITTIRQLNTQMGIPDKISDLQAADIPRLVKRALHEANPLYPVPVIFGNTEMTAVYQKILEV